MSSPRCLQILALCTFFVSSVLISAGILGFVKGPGFLQDQVNKQLPLSPDSDQLDSWSTPPVPIYLQFWLWECVNPIEFSQGQKPMLVERGPYTYLEHRKKVGIAFNDNSTVSYRQKIAYTFMRNMSVNDETTLIQMVNVPMITVITLAQSQSNLTKEILDFVFQVLVDEELFVKHTASEWIWGYEDPFLQKVQAIPIFGDFVLDDHFGFFYNLNDSDDGLYTVFTGDGNIDQLNIIDKWNGVSSLPFWDTQWANLINGTDGSWMSPLYGKDLGATRAYIYSTQICRSLYAKYENPSSVLGIPTAQFSIPSEVFFNVTLNPDNIGFGGSDSGVLNVSKCNNGAPIFISLPHLLYAADRYQNGVEGIHPDAEVHRTVLQIEPHTGLVIGAQKRLQVNVYLANNSFFKDLKSIHDVIFPSIWINESTTIDQETANDLNSKALKIFTIARWASISAITGGALLVTVGIVLLRRKQQMKNRSTHVFRGIGNHALVNEQVDSVFE